MLWFGRRKKEDRETAEKKIDTEIIQHKRDTRRQALEVKRAVDNFNKVWEENGFTVKMFSAMGGKSPHHNTGAH